jgi:hypothetical protein
MTAEGETPPGGTAAGRDAHPGPAVTRAEEELVIRRTPRPFGSARIRKELVARPVTEEVELSADRVVIDEVEVPEGAEDSGEVETTPEGHLSVPVLAQRLVVRTETYVARRLVVRRVREPHRREVVREELLAERVVVEADLPPSAEDLARARVSGGEDLSRGPTPETRHPDDAPDDVRDTTQGPTPETRRAMRATGEAAAAGQPNADPATRTDTGGDQDRTAPPSRRGTTTFEPGDPVVVRPDDPTT